MSRNWASFFAIILMLTGCTPSVTPSLTALQGTKSLQTSSLDPFITTAIPTVTISVATLPAPLSSALPISTPLPTLAFDEAKTIIPSMVQQSDNCQLPCLWGLTPGKTDIVTARAFVSQFGLGDHKSGDIELGAHNYGNSGGVSITYPREDVFISLDWSYYQNKETSILDLLTMQATSLENLGTDPTNQLPNLSPVWGNKTFNNELGEYLLPSILTIYGKPAEVLITVLPDDPEYPYISSHPFSIAMIYPEKGIYVEYVSLRDTKGNSFLGCPDKSYIYLGVWDPQSNLSMAHITEKAGSEIRLGYSKSIEEVTSLSLDEFYQIYRNSNNTVCLESPVKYWPVP